MAKKATKKTETENEKVPFQVRFDRDLHERLAEVAEESGISVNQLVQGICRGALSQVHIGAWNEHGMKQGDQPIYFVTSTPTKGCVWFGSKGVFDEVDVEVVKHGEFWFGIDVRDRGDVHFASRSPKA